MGNADVSVPYVSTPEGASDDTQLTVGVMLDRLMPSGHYMYRTVVTICTARFNILQFYVLPTQLYLCVLCGSENKQRLFPYTALTDWFV